MYSSVHVWNDGRVLVFMIGLFVKVIVVRISRASWGSIITRYVNCLGQKYRLWDIEWHYYYYVFDIENKFITLIIHNINRFKINYWNSIILQ